LLFFLWNVDVKKTECVCLCKVSMTDKRRGWGGVSKEREDIGKNFGA
jgi:hypothetical protein